MAILITGGSTGIGRGIALEFAAHGDEVFINYSRDDEAADEAARLVREAGGTPHVIKADVGTVEGARSLIAAVREHVDRLDQVVHCAARAVGGPMLEADPQEFADSVAVNALGLLNVVREALPLLQRGSTVFLISSRGAVLAIPGYGCMGTPKAISEHIVRHLAVELAPKGIRVNTVRPGALETPALRTLYPDTYKERIAGAAAANPSGRGLEFEDVGKVVYQLAGPDFAMVQGQVIAVDGGMSL